MATTSMDPHDALLGLEVAGWRSLCDGTAATFYGELLTGDALMIVAGGTVLSRDDAIRSLSGGPSWASFELDGVRSVSLGPAGAVLVYVGTARRAGEEPFIAAMASTYVLLDGRWRLALYQQTPLA